LEPQDPYAPPTTEAHDPFAPPTSSNLKPLGSLAQSARGKEISQARTILIVIGVLTMLVNGFLFFNLENEIQSEIQKANMDPAQVAEFRQAATMAGYLLYAGPALLGLIFFVFGLIVKRYPLPITITSLVLYLLSIALFAFLNPLSIAQGIIFKIIIIAALARAIKAARAYDLETRKAAFDGGGLLA
jgi:hypothetical protein